MEMEDKEDILNYSETKKCGEIFFTHQRRVIYQCSLCENKYNKIQDYGIHLIDVHYFPDPYELEDFDIYEFLPANCRNEIKSDILRTPNYLKKDYEVPIADLSNELDNIDVEQRGCVYLTQDGIIVFYCSLCSTQYNGIEKYNKHIVTQHCIEMEKEENKSLQEEFNNKLNSTNKLIEKPKCKPTSKWLQFFDAFHSTIHNEENYKCKLCGTIIRNKNNIHHHMSRIHENRKPYQCTQCDRRFHARTELKIHLRKHTGEKNCLCVECGKTFYSNSELQHHTKLKHKGVAKDKKCIICGKAFDSNEKLKRHSAIHSDARPFRCEICNARFKVRNALRTHMKIHQNKREHKCDLCSTAYNYKFMLVSHMKKKHDVVLKTDSY